MAAVSKEMFDKHIQNLSCEQVFHTWHPNCMRAWYIFVSQGSKGIFKFFFIMHAVHYIVTRKKITKKNIVKIIKDYLMSVSYGHAFSAMFIMFNCFQYKILGTFNYYLTMAGTGLFVSLTTLLTPKSRLTVESSYYSMMSLECLIRHLSYEGILPRNKLAGTPLFMLSNALMMLLLWKKQNHDVFPKLTWIFKPYSAREQYNNKLCCHKGSCMDDCIKVSTKYFLIGFGISAVKVFFRQLKKPGMSSLKLSSLKDPIFLWFYIVLQKSVHCFLNMIRGKDSGNHALIAGFVSGLSYLIQPNLSIPSSSVVLITMVLLGETKRKFSFPKLPYELMIYLAATAMLVSFSLTNRKIVPQFFRTMIGTGTSGRAEEVFRNIEDLALGGTPKLGHSIIENIYV